MLRCARGSTYLENVHLHLARFVPGSAAGAVNLQAFLLDGTTRWNTSRAAEAIQSAEAEEGLRSFDVRLIDKVNGLSQTLHGKSLFSVYTAPSMYTGELFVVEYLYDQAGLRLNSSEDNLDREIDEGFQDVEEDELATGSIPVLEEDPDYLSVYPPEESEEEEEEEEETVDRLVGSTLAFGEHLRRICPTETCRQIETHLQRVSAPVYCCSVTGHPLGTRAHSGTLAKEPSNKRGSRKIKQVQCLFSKSLLIL